MNQAVMRRPKEQPALLRNLVLGIHETKTPEDAIAERMLSELIEEISPGTTFERTCVGLRGMEAPWLFAGGSLFRGIERIKVFAKLARETAR